MTPDQQRVVLNQAIDNWACRHNNINLDAVPGDPDGFDPTPEGVWVRAWVWVPKQAIPGYSMETPAPAAKVEVVATLTKEQFTEVYIKVHAEVGDAEPNEQQIESSWSLYQHNPAGHFITRMMKEK